MKHFSVIIVFAFFILILASCSEQTGSGTLKLTIQTESKSIIPPSDAGRIIKYTVTGKGPGNKVFTENSNSKTITVEGIPNGTWELEAHGLSDKGQIIASGQKTISFSGSDSSEIIRIVKTVGKGNLSIQLNWDSDIAKPQLKFFIDNLNTGTSTDYSVNLSSGEEEYTQTFSNLESGYYLVRTVLYDDGVKKAGSCEAFSIINDYTTEGKLSLKVNTTDNQEDMKLSLPESGADYLNAGLQKMENSLVIDESYKVNLSLSNSMNSNDRILIAWYVDGERKTDFADLNGNVSSFSFSALKGRHIINAVLFDSTSQTCASARIRYTGCTDETEGTAVFSATIDSKKQQKIKLDSTTRIGVLPDGKFIVLTPKLNTLQLCHVSGASLVTETSGTYTNTMENFSCISDATLLYSSAASPYFIIVSNYTNVHFFHYNAKNNIIEPATFLNDDSVVEFIGSFVPDMSVFKNINQASIVSNSDGTSSLLFTDSYAYEIFSCVCTDKGVKPQKYIIFKPDGGPECSAFAAFNQSIVYCDGINLNQADFDGKTASSVWKSTSLYDAENPFKIFYVNNTNILMGYSDRIKRVQLNASSGTFSFLSDEMISVSDLCLTPNTSYMYACNSQGKLYSYATDYDGVFKQLDVYSAFASFVQVVSDSDNVIALTENGSLYLFDIAKEEI